LEDEWKHDADYDFGAWKDLLGGKLHGQEVDW
jgi:hypothetical protein